jgi:hypothetical protein
MTVRLLVPAYGKQTNALYTGTTAEERAFIDAGQADNNLSASFDYPDYLAGKSLAAPSLYGIDLTARLLGSTALAGAIGSPDGTSSLLVFGCSIARQSCAYASANSVVVLTANIPPRTKNVTVTSSAGFTVGQKVQMPLYTCETFTTTVEAVPDATHVTFADFVPKMVLSGQSIQSYTTVRPTIIRMDHGIISAAVAMLGAPVNLVQGYGYTGANSNDMLVDLPLWLRRVRPAFVALHLFENDISSDFDLETMKSNARTSVRMCIAAGAMPIVATSLPWSRFTTAGRIAAFDGIRSYIKNDLPALFPGKMVPLDVSGAFLDTAQPSVRVPIANYVDAQGVHPLDDWRYSYGAIAMPQIAPYLPSGLTRAQWLDSFYNKATAAMAGTAGTKSGGSQSGDVATGWSSTVTANVTATHSKVAGTDHQRTAFSISGTSDGSTAVTLAGSVAVGPSMGGGQLVRLVTAIKVNAAVNLSMIYPTLTFSTGESYAAGSNPGSAFDATVVGKTITFQGPAVTVPEGATSAAMFLRVAPKALAGVSGDIEVLFAGFVPADQPARGGIVLP